MGNKSGLLYGVYTITPLHVGTGQAVGAVDLPVAREKHTGLPFIPATSIKGVVRDILEINMPDPVIRLLGPDVKDADGLQAGSLIFTEAQSLLLPFRSLNMPFVYVTSHLVLERFERNLRAFGLSQTLSVSDALRQLDSASVYVCDKKLHGNTLVIEDMIFNGEEVFHNNQAERIAQTLGKLLPDEEESTRKRLCKGLVILPDQEYLSLAGRALPVQARIKLTKGKTTSPFPLPDGTTDKSGNLWYEESVPSDSLFAFFIMNRPGAIADKTPVDEFHDIVSAKKQVDLSVVQLGGNETVGYGWCQWHGVRNAQMETTKNAG